MVNPKSSSSTTTAAPSIQSSAKTLQDRLHELLTRLSSTIEHVRNWPDGDEASIHAERAKLISLLRETIASIQRVEMCVKNDVPLKQTLQNCFIPLDLLDLLDFELNPDCFSRGLLREAMGQLAGLRRRKNALEMLGSAIQAGLDQRDIDDTMQQTKALQKTSSSITKTSNKRDRGEEGGDEQQQQQQQSGQEDKVIITSTTTDGKMDENELTQPQTKKQKTSTDE